MQETKKQKPKKKKLDPYKNLKRLGYSMSQLPDRYSKDDLVHYAKFFLAHKTKRLMKDPIWDEYTEEELLVEFYAHEFVDNEKFRIEFEQSSNLNQGAVDEFAAWADKQIKEEDALREKLMGEAEDSVSFSPDDVMGDD